MIRQLPDALRSIGRDLAHALRSLVKDRGFTLICVISLGIGIGAMVGAADIRPHDHRAGARHRHQRAGRAAGPSARSAPRQSRRVGDRIVVLSGLPGVARCRCRHDRHRLEHWTRASSACRRRTTRRRLAWRPCSSRPTTSARSACRWRADRDSIPRSTTRRRPSRASS